MAQLSHTRTPGKYKHTIGNLPRNEYAKWLFWIMVTFEWFWLNAHDCMTRYIVVQAQCIVLHMLWQSNSPGIERHCAPLLSPAVLFAFHIQFSYNICVLLGTRTKCPFFKRTMHIIIIMIIIMYNIWVVGLNASETYRVCVCPRCVVWVTFERLSVGCQVWNWTEPLFGLFDG